MLQNLPYFMWYMVLPYEVMTFESMHYIYLANGFVSEKYPPIYFSF